MDRLSTHLYLQQNDRLEFQKPQLLLTEPHKSTGVDFKLIGENGSDVTCQFKPGETGIAAFLPMSLHIIEGSMRYRSLDLIALCKLQAFIDTSLNRVGFERNNDICWGFEPLGFQENVTFKHIEYWLIRQSLRADSGTGNIASILRSTEWYRLVRFLLQEADSTERLQDLGARYGVSVSHFRRLTRKALGNTTKVEMCDWRLVRALLDLMGEQKSLTTLAMKHGYSSLSHFSNDVKISLGVSPRSLKDVIISDAKK
ncbi:MULTISPECIES: helix-turn-helix domain-containing protein [Yersinia]|nr:MULTISPECIES: helix-turn-helix domain-containing protein [Yersinia]OWF84389.1 hypothetical protein B4914_19210 [Yersinia entomophaga]